MEQPTQMEQPTEVQVMNDRELEQLVQGFSQSPSLPPPQPQRLPKMTMPYWII